MLDLAYSNCGLVCDWFVDFTRVGGSYHFPISIESKELSKNITKFLAKKKLCESLKELVCDSNIHAFESKVQEEIKRATYVTNGNRTPKPWWNKAVNNHGKKL